MDRELQNPDSENKRSMTHEEVLKESGAVIVSPVSGSMMPFIRPNRDQAVFVSLTGGLKKNDVALYHRDGEKNLIMHRVLSREGDEYLIRGDALNCGDATERVQADHIIAVMSGFYRDENFYACEDMKYKILLFLWLKLARPVLMKYRTSRSFFWRAARFVRQKILFQRFGI